jgi:hypothetical protein
MPQINLNGNAGPSSSDPKENHSAAWDAYEKAQQDNARKSAQIDAAYGKREAEHTAQMEILWRQQQQQIKAQTAEDTRMFKQEMQARSAALANERVRETEQRRQDGIRKKINSVETKNYDTMRRQADVENKEFSQKQRLHEKQRREAERSSPYGYRVQNIDQLGRMGMRAAERDDWRGLHRSERELSHIQRRFGHHPGIAAALAQARGRIGAGSEGNSDWMMGLGRWAGAVGEMGALEGTGFALGGPYGAGVAAAGYGAYKAGRAVLDAPISIGEWARSKIGPASPYMDLRRTLSAMGRAGGINSKDLQDEFMPANGRPVGWMQRYGLGAGSAADLLKTYGIVPYSVGQGVGAVRSIAGAAYNMGVDPSLVASSAGSASHLGITNQLDINNYLKRLQQVTSVAVEQGMDRSASISSMEGLLRQATTGNTATLGSGKDLFDMYTRSMQAGTPGGRSGIDATDMVSASHQFALDTGFGTSNPGRAMAMASYIQLHGGPQSFDKESTLRTLIGDDRLDKLKSTPGGQETLILLHKAVASGSPGAVMQALQPLLDGNPGATQRVVEGSYLASVPGYWGDLMRQNVLGYSAQTYADYVATKNAPTSATSPTGTEGRKMYDILTKQGWAPKAAADMVANAYVESKFDPGASNNIGGGHYGLFQLSQERQRLFKQTMGFDIRGSSMEDQLQFNNYELNHTEKETGDVFRSGKDSGPGVSVFSLSDERPANAAYEAYRRGQLRDKIMGPLADGDPNSNFEVNQLASNVETQGLKSSQTQYKRFQTMDGGELGNLFTRISGGGEQLNEAFVGLVKRVTDLDSVLAHVNGNIDRLGRGSTGQLHPHSTWDSSNPYSLVAPRKG